MFTRVEKNAIELFNAVRRDKLARCMRGYHHQQAPDELLVDVRNIKLITYGGYVIAFGAIVLVIEVDVKSDLKRRQRKSIVRQLLVRRIRQQRVVDVIAASNRASSRFATQFTSHQ